MTEKFCLKWNDFQTNVTKSFSKLRNEDDFFDVTLVSDDKQQVSAHKLVLSSCSDYFKSILRQSKHSHPLLCLEGISSSELNNVLDYIYNGEIQIFHENLERFLQIAERFQLEGLIDGEEEISPDEIKEEVLHYSYIQSEEETTHVSSPSAQWQNTSNRKVNYFKNVISVNESDINNADEIDRQIEELIEKVGVKQYKCKTCGKINTKKSNANEHAEVHMEGLSFSCHMCEKTFRKRNTLRIHRRTCELKN